MAFHFLADYLRLVVMVAARFRDKTRVQDLMALEAWTGNWPTVTSSTFYGSKPVKVKTQPGLES